MDFEKIKEIKEDFNTAVKELFQGVFLNDYDEDLIIDEPSEKTKKEKSSQCKMKIGPLEKIRKCYYKYLETKKSKLEARKEEIKSDLNEKKVNIGQMMLEKDKFNQDSKNFK